LRENVNNQNTNNQINENKNMIEEFPLERLPTNEGFEDEDQFNELKIEGDDLTDNNFGGNVNN
jgi:hypothetical protein